MVLCKILQPVTCNDVTGTLLIHIAQKVIIVKLTNILKKWFYRVSICTEYHEWNIIKFIFASAVHSVAQFNPRVSTDLTKIDEWTYKWKMIFDLHKLYMCI